MNNEHEFHDDEIRPVDPHAEDELRVLFQRTGPRETSTNVAALFQQADQQQKPIRPLGRVMIALRQIVFNRHISEPLLRRRTIMAARIASCCLVVAGLIGLASWLVVSESTTNIAFADVQKKMKEARTVTFTLISEETVSDLQSGDIQYKYMYMGDHLARVEFEIKGEIVFVGIEDGKEGKGLMLNPIKKTAYFYEKDQKRKSNYEHIIYIVKNHKNAKKLSEKLIDGKKTIGFQLPDPGNSGAFQRVWVDSKTQLPVYMEFFSKDDAGKETRLLTATNFIFGRKLDPKLFRLELPPSYRIEPKDDVNKLGYNTDTRSVEAPLQISFADVLKTMKEVKTVTYTVTMQELGPAASILDPGDLVSKHMVSGHHARVEIYVKGKIQNVAIVDQKADKSLMLDHVNKIAYIIDQDEPDTNNPGNLSAYELFRALHSSKKKINQLPAKTIDGTKLLGFEFPLNDQKENRLFGRVWVDPESKLPVYQEDYRTDESGQLILVAIHTDFVFGKELDPKLFDLTPHGDYTLIQQKGLPPITLDPPK